MNFYKPLLLPSNGIPYSSIIHVKQIDVSLLLELKCNFINNSENDIIFSIIKKYTSITNPEKLYFKDVHFLWYYYLTLLNNDDELKIPHICHECKNKFNVKTNLSQFDIKYATKKDFNDKIFKIKDFELHFRNRLFSDNITSGIINLEYSLQENLEGLINFLKPQCTKILFNKEEQSLEDLKDVALEIGIDNFFSLIEEIRFEDWGIPSFFNLNCKKCNVINKIYISDPYKSSYYFTQNNKTENKELLELILTLSSLKIINYEEILKVPIVLWEPLVDIANKIVKKKYGSDGGSVEYFEYLQGDY